jgi:N-acetylmuramoyl-L-alanine amidase
VEPRSRLKSRLLREIVQENLDTVAGIRRPRLPARRRGRPGWLLGAGVLAAGVLFVGSTGSSSSRHGRTAEPALPPAPLAAAPAANRPSALPAPQPVDPSVFRLAVRTVVLDPGHGGSDPGAMTADRLEEKDITLDVAQRLADLLRSVGLRVVLTRTGDETVSLERRVEIANEEKADLFVSIHVNSMPVPERLGVETYYLGASNDPEIADLARVENSGSGYTLADFKTLLEKVYVGVREEESRKLAENLQAGLYSGLHRVNARLRNRGVKTAPLVVLAGTQMPAVLAEVSCISNAEEASRLATEPYRGHIAAALFEGLKNAVTAPSSGAPELAQNRAGS